jgi:hypothetical protein
MNTTNQRIAALEAELAALEAKLAALKGAGKPPVPPPQPVKDEGVRVMIIEERTTFVRPTLGELRKLYEIVCSKYPQFRPRSSPARFADQDEEEFFAGFEWAFERIGHIGRAGAPDTRRYVGHWIEETKDWLRLHRPAHRGNVGGGFLAAVIAHGDVPYIVGDEDRGVVWSIGVTPFGGKLATDAWRKVLDGQLLAPVPPERRFAAPSPSQVFVGGR